MSEQSGIGQVIDDGQGRMSISFEGHKAELTYREKEGRLMIDHTLVPREIEGKGIGGRLVQAAVDRADNKGLTIVPICSFAHRWLARNGRTLQS